MSPVKYIDIVKVELIKELQYQYDNEQELSHAVAGVDLDPF